MRDLSAVQSMPELRALLRDLLDESGLSYADLTRIAQRNGEILERGTLSDLFGERCTISEQKLRILLRALGLAEADARPWLEATVVSRSLNGGGDGC